MGLESATYVADLVSTNPVSSDPKSEGDDHIRQLKAVLKATFPNMGGRIHRALAKAINYTVVAADEQRLIIASSGITLSLTAAATLGSGFGFLVFADGAAVTIDPNGAETVNNAATMVIPSGVLALVFCDGTEFYASGVFDITRTWETLQTFKDTTFKLVDGTDATKGLLFELADIATGQTRTVTPPNWSGYLAVQARGATITAAATLDLDAASGDYVHVSGTATVTAITLSDGAEATVVFDAVTPFTHGASLLLPNSENLTTAPGDTAVFRGEASGVVRCVTFRRNARSLTVHAKELVNVAYTQTGAVATTTEILPHDDTKPQITEGGGFLSLAYTPAKATNLLRIDVHVYLSISSGSADMTAALFKDSNVDAIAATGQRSDTGNDPVSISFSHFMLAGSTSAMTFSVRGGANIAGTTTLNGFSGRKLGGVATSSLSVTEYTS